MALVLELMAVPGRLVSSVQFFMTAFFYHTISITYIWGSDMRRRSLLRRFFVPPGVLLCLGHVFCRRSVVTFYHY